jgi:hypothetical protein
LESSTPAACPAGYSHASEAGPETQSRQGDALQRSSGLLIDYARATTHDQPQLVTVI